MVYTRYERENLEDGSVLLLLQGEEPHNRIIIGIKNGRITRLRHFIKEYEGRSQETEIANPSLDSLLFTICVISSDAIIDIAELLSKTEPSYDKVIEYVKNIRGSRCTEIDKLKDSIQRIDAILKGST